MPQSRRRNTLKRGHQTRLLGVHALACPPRLMHYAGCESEFSVPDQPLDAWRSACDVGRAWRKIWHSRRQAICSLASWKLPLSNPWFGVWRRGACRLAPASALQPSHSSRRCCITGFQNAPSLLSRTALRLRKVFSRTSAHGCRLKVASCKLSPKLLTLHAPGSTFHPFSIPPGRLCRTKTGCRTRM